jgi:hypothetical protein
VTGGRFIDASKRIIRIAEWGAKYASSQIDICIQKIDEEANINSLITLKNKRVEPKTKIANISQAIIKSKSEDQLIIKQLELQDIIATIYPEVKYEGRDLTDYEPHFRMLTLAKLISGYKRISINAYNAAQTISNIIIFRTYVTATLPEGDIHQKAVNKLREYTKITQHFNTEKR